MGWYPDPSGERQWRWWTASAWTSSTIPYGDRVEPVSIVSDIALIQALHRLVRYAIAMFFVGLAFLVSVQAHWPGSAKPVSETFAVTVANVAVALVLFGSVCFAFAAHELEGRWTWWAFVPVVNLFAVLSRRHSSTRWTAPPTRRCRRLLVDALRRSVPQSRCGSASLR